MYYISWHMAMWMPKLVKICEMKDITHTFATIVYTPFRSFASIKTAFQQEFEGNFSCGIEEMEEKCNFRKDGEEGAYKKEKAIS